MSLNFVSSAVLTSTDGVSHNEEKAVESTEADSVRRQQQAGGHKPLFEQLRSNADAAQEERDAAAKAMRGTRTLDEEDCAHLDSIERRRMERDAAVRRGVEDEVAAFRAARAERMADGSTELLEEGGDIGGAEVGLNIGATKPSIAVARGVDEANAPSLATLAQKVVIKKKRKRQPNGQSASGTTNTTTNCNNDGDAASKRPKDLDKDVEIKEDGGDTKKEASKNDGDDKSDRSKSDRSSADEGAGGLGALLGGYGSDSDSD